jgi:hypothetical protein
MRKISPKDPRVLLSSGYLNYFLDAGILRDRLQKGWTG